FCWIETDEAVIAPVVPEPHSDAAPVRRKRASVLTTTYSEPKDAKPRMTMEAFRLMQEEKISHEELFNFFQGKIPLFTEYHIKRLLEKRDADIQSQHDVAVMSDLAQKGSVRAVPLARTIAREKGVDLAHVQGTGPDGLILASDIGKKVDTQEVRIDRPMAIAQEFEEPILLSMPRLWRTIAANMEAGMRIPTVDDRIDSRRFNIKRLTELYGNSRQSFKKVWLPLMVAYARVLGNERFAVFNSYWHEEIDNEGKITPYVAVRKYVHMGIAYDRGELPIIDLVNKTIKGERLRILTVRNAHVRSLKDITSEIDRLFEAAAQKQFSLQDTSGYTAIFNNLGVLRIHSGRSILTKGIASMLNLGLVDMESGEAVIQCVVDHRPIDGAKTAPFFIALYKELMQRVLPELETLLLEKK
ncbi:MAG: E3 binding domain-containing protein, partial [Patescibacteria group bacterium]